MSFNIGENVGPYRIIEQLGQGGMATVFKAYHAALDRYVALKVLHPAFHQDQSFTMRFQREARVVARLEHPNIVPIYDYSEHEARPYLVMKYIEGDTLKARLNQGPLLSEEIENVVNSVGAALAYAHRQGILHRDIKPSNVMIATDGMIYLADFGLARIAEAGESTMSSDSIMGTPQYISPEQAMGKKDLDAGTDIYSFGVMLYEMVVGQVPFSADTPFSIIHDHIYTPLPLPRKVNPNVPEPVQRVLLKSLAKDRLDRYQKTEELISSFKEAWMEAGIPMRGTAMTLPHGTIQTVQSAAPQVQPQVSQTTNPAIATVKESKPRSPWMWVSLGLVIVLCLVSVLGFSLRKRGSLAAFLPDTPTPTQSAEIPAQPTPLPPTRSTPVAGGPSDPAGEIPPPSNSQSDDANVQTAKEFVAKDPNNPSAHLQLALALWDARQPRPAFDSLAQAMNLADPNDKTFILEAAESFKKRDAWVAATNLYLRLVPLYGEGEMPVELETDLHEAVYKSTEQRDMPLLVIFDRIDSVSQSLGHVARGRFSLFNGTLDDAKSQLFRAQELEPDMYEARLLEAEIRIKDGRAAEAKEILALLIKDPNVPEWIRFMSENTLTKIQ